MSKSFESAQRAYKAGRINEAVGLLNQEIALNPRNDLAHHLLGIIDARESRFEAALRRFDSAISIDSKKLSYLVDRANVIASLGRPEEAIEAYDRALALNPKLVQAISNKGQAFRLLGQFDKAIACFRDATLIDPSFVDAHRSLGQVLWSMLQFEEAIASYSVVLKYQPTDIVSLLHRGICLSNVRQFDKAFSDFKRIISFVPDHAEAHARAANALNELEKFRAALEYANAAIALDSKNPEWVGFKCKALIGLDRPRDALKEVDLMIKLGAKEDLYLMWQGTCHIELHEFEKAEEIYSRMIRKLPESGFWYFNRGVALAKQRRYLEAVSSYDEAIVRDATLATAYWNKSLCTLVQGDPRGWELYEWRWKLPSGGPALANQPKHIPKWHGYEEIRGKRILLSAEQGFGDTLMFCRFAPLVKDMGAIVDIGVPKPLRRVISTLQKIDEVIDSHHKGAEKAYDFYCPLMSLPRILGTSFDDLPYGNSAYLRSDPQLVNKWRDMLDVATNRSGKPRIGLMWGGRKVISLGSRSVNLEALLSLVSDRFDFISLQKELPDGDAETLQTTKIHHFGEQQDDFADAAAMIALVDLVITIDTSIAHLAGALGKETWVLLQFDSEWRWLQERDDSPWYPHTKLFRQSVPGDWSEVVGRVHAEMLSRWP
jgi:tetratricopeptide (TPR) repeat protein